MIDVLVAVVEGHKFHRTIIYRLCGGGGGVGISQIVQLRGWYNGSRRVLVLAYGKSTPCAKIYKFSVSSIRIFLN